MKRVFDFMKTRTLMFVVSAVVIVGGIVGTVVQGGFNLGIDFQPGLNLTVEVDAREDLDIEAIRSALVDYEGAQIQRLGDAAADRFVIRIRDDGSIDDFAVTISRTVLDDLRSEFDGATVTELENAYVGPRFSRDLTQQAVFLTVFALVLILAYLWFRFRFGYAVASISALVHDVLVILGVIGTFQLEVSIATIAAVLTIIGYSLNDTIVIFDRIRENETLIRENPFRSIVNISISQSLSRTLITSLTTLLAVLAIFIFSTGQIQLFALKLMIGVVVGTYSSVFVASPVLMAWSASETTRRKRKDMEKFHKGAVARPSGNGSESASPQEEVAQATTGIAEVEAAKREVVMQRSKKKNRKSR